MSINSVDISGHLTRDPDLRATQGKTSVLNFSIAVNDRRKNPQTGEWEERPNYVDVSLFGSRADWMARDLRKGKLVTVSGKLRYSSWEKDGERRSKLSVIADDVDYERPPRQQQQQFAAATPAMYEDNPPF